MADTSSPAPAAAPPPPAASGGSTVSVRVPWPTTVFEHGIDGIEPITAEPTEIPQSAIAQLQEKARSAGLELIVEEAK